MSGSQFALTSGTEALTTIKNYFQQAFARLNLGKKTKWEEWKDAFAIDNIPNTKLDCAWHFTIGAASQLSFNQHCLSQNVPVTINAWVKGFKTPAEAVDNGLQKIESIIKETCRHRYRLNQPYVKNVQPTGFNVEALGFSNDNIAKLTISFDLLVHIDIEV